MPSGRSWSGGCAGITAIAGKPLTVELAGAASPVEGYAMTLDEKRTSLVSTLPSSLLTEAPVASIRRITITEKGRGAMRGFVIGFGLGALSGGLLGAFV